MSWNHSKRAQWPETNFMHSTSLVYAPTLHPDDPLVSPYCDRPKFKFYNLTKGFNCQTVVPHDPRYTEYYSYTHGIPNYKRSDRELWPESLLYYLGQEGDALKNPLDAHDPTMGDLMDLGSISNEAKDLETVLAYVTSEDKTTIGASLLGLKTETFDKQVNKSLNNLSDDSLLDETSIKGASSKVKVQLPELQSFSVIRSDSAVKQLEVLDALESVRPGLLVRTGLDISLHSWRYNYDEDTRDPSIFVNHTIRLPLKQSGSRPVVDCTTSRTAPNWISTIRSDGSLTQYFYVEGSAKFAPVKCPSFHFSETLSYWHRISEVYLPSSLRTDGRSNDPGLLMVGNRKSVRLFNTLQNRYIADMHPKEMKLRLENIADFKPASSRTLDKTFDGSRNGVLTDYQYFLLTGDDVMWMDLRHSSKPILSSKHMMNAQDPSLRLNMSYCGDENNGFHLATVYSQAVSTTSILEFGRETPLQVPEWEGQQFKKDLKEFEKLPIVYNDVQTFHTHLGRRTQSLKLVQLPAFASETASNMNFSSEGPSKDVIALGAFEFSLDNGLYFHVLANDSSINVDLSKSKSSSRFIEKVTALRSPQDPNDASLVPNYHNLRDLYTSMAHLPQNDDSTKTMPLSSIENTTGHDLTVKQIQLNNPDVKIVNDMPDLEVRTSGLIDFTTCTPESFAKRLDDMWVKPLEGKNEKFLNVRKENVAHIVKEVIEACTVKPSLSSNNGVDSLIAPIQAYTTEQLEVLDETRGIMNLWDDTGVQSEEEDSDQEMDTQLVSSQPSFSQMPSSQHAFSQMPSSQPTFSQISSSQPTFSQIRSSQPGFGSTRSSQRAFTPARSSQPGFSQPPSSQPRSSQNTQRKKRKKNEGF